MVESGRDRTPAHRFAAMAVVSYIAARAERAGSGSTRLGIPREPPAGSGRGQIDSRRHPLRHDPMPGRIELVARITHHEVVIRWDSPTTDESATVTSDAKLTEAWRKIVVQHVDVPSMAPTFEVTARSWTD
jgi:hypothetical protein